MARKYDEDQIGAVLEYAVMFAVEKDPAKRLAWVQANVKVGPAHDVWMGPALSRRHLEDILSRGRDRKKVKETLLRIFAGLERAHLLEVDPNDDDPHTEYRRATLLGAELLLDDAVSDYLGGFPSIVRRWRGSVAKINGPDQGIGTGFLVSPRIIATARHVVEDLPSFEVRLEGGEVLAHKGFRVPSELDDLDLALIDLREDVSPAIARPLRLQSGADVLDEVVTLGYPPVPQTREAHQLANRGEISAIVQLHSGLQALVISTMLRGGHSGGPLINQRGDVVGVVSRNLTSRVLGDGGTEIEAMGFSAAFSAEWLADLLSGVVPTRTGAPIRRRDRSVVSSENPDEEEARQSRDP